jgi:hypothetical protein
MGVPGSYFRFQEESIVFSFKNFHGHLPQAEETNILYSMANTDVYKYYININMYTLSGSLQSPPWGEGCSPSIVCCENTFAYS